MARTTIESLETDFASVVVFLKERGVLGATIRPGTLESAKRIHRATYSLILWRFRLRGLPEHGRVFIEEIASDALQILPQVLMGCMKTGHLLTRGIIENTLRHIYFSDHPIEFARMNREAKWYMTVESLFEYPKAHPAFLDLEAKFDALSRLSALYSELSATVHGRTVRDLEMRVALADIQCDDSELRKQTTLTERCAEAANFLLAIFHREQMRSFPADDKRIILRSMPSQARRLWTHEQ